MKRKQRGSSKLKGKKNPGCMGKHAPKGSFRVGEYIFKKSPQQGGGEGGGTEKIKPSHRATSRGSRGGNTGKKEIKRQQSGNMAK